MDFDSLSILILKKKSFYFLAIILFFYSTNTILSCKEANTTQNTSTDSTGEFGSPSTKITKNGNNATTISTDIALQKKYLTFNYFKPGHVKFHLNYIDNSGSNERLTVPGPSDFYLEAILYFDSLTFDSIKAAYLKPGWVAPKYNRDEFNFDWLDKPIKEELLNLDSSYHGHVDLFFTMPNNKNCHTWMLNEKLLIHWSSQ